MWDRAEASLKAALDGLGPRRTSSSPATARSTARRSTSTSPTASAASGSSAPIQLDYAAPERFDLTYVGEDGKPHRPVVLHRAIYGSFERFIAILIEHFAGAFPVWLAPVQVAIVTVTDRVNDHARTVVDAARARQGVRVDVRRRQRRR